MLEIHIFEIEMVAISSFFVFHRLHAQLDKIENVIQLSRTNIFLNRIETINLT